MNSISIPAIRWNCKPKETASRFVRCGLPPRFAKIVAFGCFGRVRNSPQRSPIRRCAIAGSSATATTGYRLPRNHALGSMVPLANSTVLHRICGYCVQVFTPATIVKTSTVYRALRSSRGPQSCYEPRFLQFPLSCYRFPPTVLSPLSAAAT